MKIIDLVQTLGKEELPENWHFSTITELVGSEGFFSDGDWVESKDQDPEGEVRLIQLADIGEYKFRDKSSRYLTYEKARELKCSFLEKGDILIARMPDPLGRACIFPGDEKSSITAVDVAIVRSANDKFNHKWLMYFLNAPAVRAAIESLQSGSTRKRISRKNLARIVLPVPPRNQQDLIVAKIEKQFSRLDDAVASLKRAKANLKRYKVAVLKAAVEGKLTEEWREQHPDVEPASELLKRILAERRRKWEEAELAKMRAMNKESKDDKWKQNYRDPESPDCENLPTLPLGWQWITSDQLCFLVTSGSRGWAKYYSDEGPVFLRMGNLDHNTIELDLKNTQHVQPPKQAEGKRTQVKTNDILISITADVGMVALVPENMEEAYINQHVALTRPISCINSEFVARYLSSRFGQKQYQDLQRGATKAGLGLDDIRSINIPLPSLEEQTSIVAQIESLYSITNNTISNIEANLHRISKLHQNILLKAFSGELNFHHRQQDQLPTS